MTENEISYKIIGAIYKVYNELGPGLLESVYEAALCYQLRKDGLRVENQVKLDVMYDGKVLPVSVRIQLARKPQSSPKELFVILAKNLGTSLYRPGIFIAPRIFEPTPAARFS